VADYDLAIIGGGINGAGIARDAAGRGIKVLLVEQRDLGSGTSSASSKLIHGGLRYLEHGAFLMVRAALAEREILWRMAPHLIRPQRFVLPLDDNMRPAWLVRFGLFAYDALGRRDLLPGTRSVDLIVDPAGAPLKRRFHAAYEYSDCVVDDSRLVVMNALDAAERGASIRPWTRCVHAERGETWRLVLMAHGRRVSVTARVLVSAAGAWSDIVADTVLRQKEPRRLRLDKGTHIVVPRLYEHPRAYLLQVADRRVVFAIPYREDYTLIGTTDRGFAGDPAGAAPTGEEIDYLVGVVNDYFRNPIGASDVVWAYAGVRALYDDGSGKAEDVGREYHLALDKSFGVAPLLTIYGGKVTTYRRLAEDALGKLARFFPRSRPWTGTSSLPGGDFVHDGVPALIERARRRYPFLTAGHARRLVDAYGTRVDVVLKNATRLDDLGPRFGADLTAAEVRYLMNVEWARDADDVLWRRSKLGLKFSGAQKASLHEFMAAEQGAGEARKIREN
jgi:glycerol-3-phosphate dehydrogenase